MIKTGTMRVEQHPRQQRLSQEADGSCTLLMQHIEHVIYKFDSYEEWREYERTGGKVIESGQR